jgi:signal transduction histidine kinase
MPVFVEALMRKRADEALREARDELEVKVAERTRELTEANIRLKEIDHLKSEFLATMSHELRTPLNSIIGFTGIILQGMSGELNDEQKKQLNMVYDSAKHLLGLINDILDLSKIEAGKIEIIPAWFEVKDLVQMVEKMISPLIEEKGLTFQVAISENVPLTIYSDKNRIKQVLINLLSNATKFTESGGIRLTVKMVSGSELSVPGSEQHATRNSESETKNFIAFSVSDTGIGIKPDLFSDFFD